MHSTDVVNYYSFSGFSDVYLEDSYVLGIRLETFSVEFDLDLVITEHHELYVPPANNEQYCYKKAKLSFLNATDIKWIEKNMVASEDASGSIDFGNIDEFFLEDGKFHIKGDWGYLEIVSSTPKLYFTI